MGNCCTNNENSDLSTATKFNNFKDLPLSKRLAMIQEILPPDPAELNPLPKGPELSSSFKSSFTFSLVESKDSLVLHLPNTAIANQTEKMNEIDQKAKEVETRLPEYSPVPPLAQSDFTQLPKTVQPLRYKLGGATYFGQLNQGKREGYGIQVEKDGSLYRGYWKGDLREGEGRSVKINGNFYEGEWKAGLKSGKGTGGTDEGGWYQGQWAEDAPNGKGMERYDNGNYYEGDFVNGMRQGDGKYTFDGDEHWYEGQFLEDQYHGKGKRGKKTNFFGKILTF